MLNPESLIHLQDAATNLWHREQSLPPSSNTLEDLALQQHRANFDLWHEEDQARSPEASNADITRVKHAIDRLNQQRNDLVEQIDAALLLEAGPQNPSAPLHSETPGLIVDRLSILALKIFHTAEEAHRITATEQHRSRNLDRLAILQVQRSDLAQCLAELWTEVLAGRRRFKLYKQMKMYNDPDLNPVLYSRTT